MKLTLEKLDDFFDTISTPSTAKSYKARIAKLLRNSDDIYGDIVSLKILTDIVKSYTSASSIKSHVQVFLKIIAEYPGFKISEKAKKKYEEVFKEANADMNQGYIQKSMEDSTESFSSIKQKVFDGFPEGSDERLFIELYEICPMRDNYGSLFIVPTIRQTKDKSKNYCVVSQKTLQINVYKTADKYGSIECKIPLKIWRKIDLTKEKVFDHGDTMTSFVGTMLKSVGIDGRINTLRHAFLSEKLDGDAIKDPEVRKELAKSMGHSGAVQLQYIRELQKPVAETTS